MEKTIAEAEQRLHGGSSSAAPKVLAVDVDSEALDWPRCLRPLVPPVFQCAAGHVVCSTCHDSLPDKDKCASCFFRTGYSRCSIPTRYSRCLPLERVVRSVRVACRNAFYGCTAGKMLYHEREEHEKMCPISMADSGILPRGIVKIGPFGGSGGNGKDMDVRGVSRIVKLVVWHRCDVLDAMSVSYERDGREEVTEQWGAGTGAGERSEICLEADEYLTGVKGHVDHYDDRLIVRSLTFVGNRRTLGPYGEKQGVAFELLAAGGKIIGFHGRADSYIYALGIYVKMYS